MGHKLKENNKEMMIENISLGFTSILGIGGAMAGIFIPGATLPIAAIQAGTYCPAIVAAVVKQSIKNKEFSKKIDEQINSCAKITAEEYLLQLEKNDPVMFRMFQSVWRSDENYGSDVSLDSIKGAMKKALNTENKWEASGKTPKDIDDVVNAYVQLFFINIGNYHELNQTILLGTILKLDEVVEDLDVLKRKVDNLGTSTLMQRSVCQRSFSRIIDSVTIRKDNNNPFHYRNNIIPFVGRKKELKQLQEFLDDDRDLLWMSVTGEGGVGKSKLIYYFVENYVNQFVWKAVWVNRNLMESIMTIKEYNEWDYQCNLLLIIDYAAEVANELGEWIERVSETAIRPAKLRYIILERENANANKDDRGLEPIWFVNFIGESRRRRCLKEYHYEDIELCGLNENEYPELIREFVSCEYKRELSDTEIESIMNASKKVDTHNQLPRILIVLIASDAYVRDPEFSNWNVENLIENVIKRYKDHWKAVIDEALCYQEACAVMKSLLDMLLYSTARGGWAPDEESVDPEGPFAESATRIANLEIRGTVFSMINCSPDESDILNALEPDLIGECFVLMVLKGIYLQNKKRFKTIVDAIWKNSPYFAWVVKRCLDNYYSNGEFSILFDGALEPLLPRNILEGNSTYLRLLIWLISYQSEEKAVETVKFLESLMAGHGNDEEYVGVYAMCLLCLAEKQPEEKAAETIKLIESFEEGHRDNELVARANAGSFYVLAGKQPEEKAAETIKLLGKIAADHRDNVQYVKLYTEGLYQLAKKQPEERAAETIKILGRIVAGHGDDERAVQIYAASLYSLASNQPEESAEETIKVLGSLAEVHADDKWVVQSYAAGLNNLAEKQTAEKATRTIGFLGSLAEDHRDSEQVVNLYAGSLCTLVKKQPEEKAAETVKTLESLTVDHKDNDRVVGLYAVGLRDLLIKQPEEQATETIKILESLVVDKGNNEGVIRSYASGLMHLSQKQSEEKAAETIKILESFVADHRDNEGAVSSYATALYCHAHRQPKNKALETIKILGSVAGDHGNNDQVARSYAAGLMELTEEQSEEKAIETIKILESLVAEHGDNKEVVESYATGLYNLSQKQSEEKAAETIEILRILAEKHADYKRVLRLYAGGLYFLALRLPEEKETETVKILGRLEAAHEKDKLLERAYASGLMDLAKKQPEEKATKTIKILQSFAEQHGDNDKVVYIFASSLIALVEKQSGGKALETIKILESLAKAHPDDENIRQVYAAGFLDFANKQLEDKKSKMKEILGGAASGLYRRLRKLIRR